MSMKFNKIVAFAAVLLWMGVIFVLSTQVGARSHGLSMGIVRFDINFIRWVDPDAKISFIFLDYIIRKNAHFFVYMVLGILVYKFINLDKGRYNTALAIAICVLFAASDEFHQIFVSDRTPLVSDVVLDGIGAAFGILICNIVNIIRRNSPLP